MGLLILRIFSSSNINGGLKESRRSESKHNNSDFRTLVQEEARD